MNKHRFAALLLSASFWALTACGGGGGRTGNIGSGIPPAPTPMHTAGNSSGGQATIRIAIPATSSSSTNRRRNFVGADVEGATVAVSLGTASPTTTTFDLSSTSTICTTVAPVRSCVMTVTAPFGSDTFVVTTYDTAPVGGTIPTTAHILGTGTIAQAVTITGTPAITISVQGVIGGLGTVAPLLTLPGDGTSHTASVMIDPVDFANQPITAGTSDPYSNPITATLTETGGTGLVKLTVNGTAVGSTATLTQSSQTLGLAYSGGGTPGYYATVTLSAPNVTNESFDVAPLYVTSTSSLFSNQTVGFTGANQTATLTISEAQGTNTYNLGTPTSSACNNAASVGGISGSGTSGSVMLTSGTSGVSGGCGVVITDSLNTAVTVYFTNTITGGGITIGGISEYGTPVTAPNEIVAGIDGNIYVASTTGPTIWGYTTGGSETNWSSTLTHSPTALAAGPDGNIWFVDGTGNLYTYSPVTESVGTFTPSGSGNTFNGIALGPDGNMWALDTTNDQIVEEPPYLATGPVISMGGFAPAYMVTVGNSAWVVTRGPNAMLYRIIPGSNPFTYTVPGGAGNSPSAIAADGAGNIWIADRGTNDIDEFVPGTATWNGPYPIGGSGSLNGIAVGPDGNIWFDNSANDTVGKFNPTTTSGTTYPIPTASSSPGPMTVGSDGRIWFTEANVTQIGAVTP